MAHPVKSGSSLIGLAHISPTDWIGCYSTDGGGASGWVYTSRCPQNPGGNAAPSGSCVFTMPVIPGSYEFRLYSDGGHNLVAKSPIAIVQ